MKKVLVTGVCGFIGSHLAEVLLKEYKVVGIDNCSLGTKENIRHIKNVNFTFHEVDILEHKAFENIFRTHSFDAIFHLAGNSNIQAGSAESNFRDTFSTTCVLLEKCRIRGIKQFVFTSSGAVYGERDEVMGEGSLLAPISHYAAAKVASEAFISSYANMYGIQAWILRFPSVIGERMTHGTLYDWTGKIKASPDVLTVLGDGNQSKPFMYVKDLIDAMLFVWKNAKEKVNIFNIAGEGYTTIKELAEMFLEGKNTKIIYQGTDRGWNGDIPKYRCDTSKLAKLGWKTQTTSEEAVRLTLSKI